MCANCNMYEGTCGQQKQTGYHRKSSEMIYYRVELQSVLYGKHWAQADFILSMSAGPLDKISSSDSECTDICEPAWFFFFRSLGLVHWYYSAPTTPCVRNRVIQAPDSIYPKLTSMFVTAVAIKSITVKSQSKFFKHIKRWFKFKHETNRKDLPPQCFTKWQLFTELRASKN